MAAPLETDTVVVGLGAMGAQALWRLARRGVDVIGVEQFTPGHDRGSSHGESRIIRTAYMEGAAYVPLVRSAWRAWSELEEASGTRLVVRTGALMLGAPDSPAVTGSVTAAEHHGLPHQVLSRDQVAERFPQHVLRPGEVGVFEEDAGVVLPEAAITAAVRLAREAGARVLTGARATRVVPDPDRPRVVVGDTVVRARRVVVTAGSWLPRLVPEVAELGGGLRVERRVLGWFRTTRDPSPHAHGPVFARDGNDCTWYGFPSMDGGRTVKIGVHAEAPGNRGEGVQWGEPVDPDAGPREPDAADARRLGRLAAGLSGVAPLPERMASCMYTMTPDEHFVIGQRRELPGLVLAGGFSGHGYKFASAVGEALADLAQHGRTELAVDLFDPHRWD
ncbi:N-methyl-L-tryptophan oxidase [Nocardiopsis akebiae]|uniref:N-methyl-L-tryptophan oxidase n=1 Tax=Nocardiopsis akebiae TaxID=2831968 RepID=A0ABX8CBH0_9ACTN|nr:N-methyl-L-tryptophan oxidase [Nocardiopsis akebiae]QUX30381.1 N-methyl-L-tryptophan oxidase [Nocardiopsis akebiae]